MTTGTPIIQFFVKRIFQACFCPLSWLFQHFCKTEPYNPSLLELVLPRSSFLLFLSNNLCIVVYRHTRYDRYEVIAGKHTASLDVQDPTEQRVSVTSFIKHDEYDRENSCKQQTHCTIHICEQAVAEANTYADTKPVDKTRSDTNRSMRRYNWLSVNK